MVPTSSGLRLRPEAVDDFPAAEFDRGKGAHSKGRAALDRPMNISSKHSLDVGLINSTYGLWETQSPLLGSMVGGMEWSDDGNGWSGMSPAVPITPPPTNMVDVGSCR
jgi:hypothetical protein